MGSIEENSALTSCQSSLKLQAADAERLIEAWSSERGLIRKTVTMLNDSSYLMILRNLLQDQPF